CSSPKVYSGLGEGSHTFSVRARDTAGNLEPEPALHAWLVLDTTPPNTTITSTPENPTESTTASFAFSSDDPAAIYDCTLDGVPFPGCTSPREFTGLSIAPHTFSVLARDATGNIEPEPASYTWTVVDLTTPDTTLHDTPG